MDMGAVGTAESWLNVLAEMKAKLAAAKVEIEKEQGVTFDEATGAIKGIAIENLAVGDSIQGNMLEVVMNKGRDGWHSAELHKAIEADPKLKHIYRKRGKPYPTIRAIKMG